MVWEKEIGRFDRYWRRGIEDRIGIGEGRLEDWTGIGEGDWKIGLV